VLQVEDLGNVPAVTRDLALVKVAVAGHDRAHLLRVVTRRERTSSTRRPDDDCSRSPANRRTWTP
jgi:hypothetical protein